MVEYVAQRLPQTSSEATILPYSPAIVDGFTTRFHPHAGIQH